MRCSGGPVKANETQANSVKSFIGSVDWRLGVRGFLILGSWAVSVQQVSDILISLGQGEKRNHKALCVTGRYTLDKAKIGKMIILGRYKCYRLIIILISDTSRGF